MNKVLRILIICVLALGVISVQAQDEEVNLLTNPGFELPYSSQAGNPTREVAQGWTAWHIERQQGDPSWRNRQPSYAPVTAQSGRVRSGDTAQSIFNNTWWAHEGGVYQRVTNVTPGAELRFSVYAYVWSSSYEDTSISRDPGEVTIEVGIDPTGGTDPESTDIVWSFAIQQYDAYRQYSQIATAQGNAVTVWVRSTVGFPVQNSFIYLDDAVLSVTPDSEQPASTETALPTPISESTATTEPTPTAEIDEPEEEDTPSAGEPTMTSTATTTPTATATNTATLTATPTQTPLPVFTRPPGEEPTPTLEVIEPTNTPVGGAVDPVPLVTNTPVATVTPRPTEDTSTVFLNTVGYSVRRGDTVGRLAALYGSTIDAINRANDLNADNLIFVGQQLIIPVPIAAPATSTPSPTPLVTNTPVPEIIAPPSTSDTVYIVQRGDTLNNIANRFNTTIGEIAQRNGIVNINRIFAGQRLIIPVVGQVGQPQPPTQPQPPAQPRTYTVRPGDTLLRISVQLGVSIDALAQANGILNRNLIFTGQVLTIP